MKGLLLCVKVLPGNLTSSEFGFHGDGPRYEVNQLCDTEKWELNLIFSHSTTNLALRYSPPEPHARKTRHVLTAGPHEHTRQQKCKKSGYNNNRGVDSIPEVMCVNCLEGVSNCGWCCKHSLMEGFNLRTHMFRLRQTHTQKHLNSRMPGYPWVQTQG